MRIFLPCSRCSDVREREKDRRKVSYLVKIVSLNTNPLLEH